MNNLKNIKVLDLTRVLAGPYCTMILGDFGASIIKVERPVTGDDSRSFGPFYEGDSCYYKSINRNKKSITIDLKKEEGKEILRNLIKSSDVIVENFRPGTMEKLGFAYESVSRINPSIIYASISGYGHSGPYSQRPAYDAIVQAMGGLMSITGQEDSEPTRVGSSIGDINAGMYGAIAILGALYKKATTGEGERIDIAMLDCQVALLENAIARYAITGTAPKPMGNRHSSIVPFELFKTADSSIMIAIGNNKLWQKFCAIVDNDSLSSESYASNDKRYKNYSQLKELLDKMFSEHVTAYWEALLNEHDIPCSQVNSIDMVVKNKQIHARNMIIEDVLDEKTSLLIPSTPIKYKTSEFEYQSAPSLGQDTDDILIHNLGMSQDDLNELKEKGVL